MDEVEMLLKRAANRDTSAFEVLYDRFSRLVFSIALRIVSDTEAAEDIVQTVFLKIWLAPQQYSSGNFPAWLARVTRNASLDYLRSKSRYNTTEIPADIPAIGQLDESVFARLDGQRIRAALSKLPDEQRLPIELGFFGGITHEEISRQVAAPLGTVKTRIRSGLQKLRRILNDEVAL